MTDQEWLNRWMIGKAWELKLHYPDLPEYYLPEDAEDILCMSDEDALRVKGFIIEFVTKWIARSGLNSHTYPFCIYFDNKADASTADLKLEPDCLKCGYGKRHGMCIPLSLGSDWKKIRNHLESVWQVDENTFIFPKEFYQDLLISVSRSGL